MARLRGTDALTQCLSAMEVRRIYGVIGTSIVGFLDGLYEVKENIRYVSCRHEQVAGSMADAEGRLTRRPGVVALHSGPGALNAMISLANAAKDCSPVLAVAGSIKRKLQGCDGMLELDHVRVFRPLCRGTFRIEAVRDIPKIMSLAWKAAMSGPGGPALVEVPEDIWVDHDEVDLGQLDLTVGAPPRIPKERLDEIARRLLDAARPVLLAGAGVSYTNAGHRLQKLAERLKVPVVTTGNGRGAISELHPLSCGRAGYGGGNPVADEALRRADFILGVGCTMSDMTTYEYTWPIQADVVVVNLDEDNDQKRIPLEAVLADARQFIDDFLQALDRHRPQERATWITELEPSRQAWKNLLDSARNPARQPVSPALVCDRLRGRLPADAIITVGAGLHLLYPMAFIPSKLPLTFLSAVNFGAMGFGFPASLAAKLIYPERPVIAVLGDGDFLMTVQDLETAVRERIPVRIFIVNDNSYRVLAFRQRVQFQGRVHGTLHDNPDFCKLADSFHIPAWRIDGPEQIDGVLDAALAATGPSVVEIVTAADDVPPMNLEAAMRMS
ncbi:MAG TPA: thiamine pyrophosphate-binding protein [Planctomycetaceae bacterium]|nr:thiamine pyrophosphate-binding protein [Planctomycetaceae bacterium]